MNSFIDDGSSHQDSLHQKHLADFFCEQANREALHKLREGLPLLALHTPFLTECIECKPSARLLQSYYECYGFNELRARNSNLNYHFGYIQHGGFTLVGHVWRVPSSTEFVVIAHGLFDHVGLYLKLVQDLLCAGFSVVAVDMPGHGLSSGEPGVINDFVDYAKAIEGTVRAISKGLTACTGINDISEIAWSAVGQSTGSAAIMRFLFNEDGNNLPSDGSSVSLVSGSLFKKVVLIAPLVKPASWWSVFLSFVVLSKFLVSVKRRFTKNSHDEVFVTFLREKDPLQSKRISVKWIGAMIHWVKRFSLFSPCSVPMLIVQGTGDETVDFSANIRLIQDQFVNCEVFKVDGAMHHLVNETDEYRIPAFKKIIEFLK